jgi:hypothetical protein
MITRTVAAASLLAIALPAPAFAAPAHPAAQGRCVELCAAEVAVVPATGEAGPAGSAPATGTVTGDSGPAGEEAPSFGVFFLFAFLFVGLGAIGFALTRASGNRDAHPPPALPSTVLSPPVRSVDTVPGNATSDHRQTGGGWTGEAFRHGPNT